MKGLIKSAAAVFITLMTAVMGIVGYYDAVLPEHYYISGGSSSTLMCLFDVELAPKQEAIEAYSEGGSSGDGASDEGVEGELKLWGIIPIKDAKISRSEAKCLIPGGSPVGIKLLTDGVMVVKVQDVAEGECPAVKARLAEGDNIISADGVRLHSSTQLSEIIEASGGKDINLEVSRDGRIFTTVLTPIYSEKECAYKGGLWIRDSSAGVGMLTFTDPETGSYGALGHPISDCDTMKTLPLGSGEIVDVTITGYEKGERGCPGELFGTFVSGLASGSIIVNCEQGVFGKMTYSSRADAIPIAFKSEVKQGPAKILTTISGNKPQEFDIEIEKLTISSACKTKNIVIKVTDPRLLEATGGIVQGMSGSPIIQDGKLVGAVTHVFVSDPTRGYGIFIENMMEAGSGGMDKAA